MILGVLLAAGQSRRYGPQDKLLADRDGMPLVLHAARNLLASECDRVLAVVSSDPVAAILPSGIESCRVEPGLAMSWSWHQAVLRGRDLESGHLVFALGDMPNLDPATFARLIGLAQSQGGAACLYGGIRMPPACLALQACLPLLEDGAADQGARPLLAGLAESALLPLTAHEALDIDLPGDG